MICTSENIAQALLALRRRAFEMKALGKKHKKALRAEKRVYLKAVTTYLPGTPAMLDLQNEVSAPLLERVKASLAATLNDGGNSAGSGGILGALNETRDRARVDFGRASREWGIAFDRTSMEGFVAALSDVVTKAEQQFQPSGTVLQPIALLSSARILIGIMPKITVLRYHYAV